MKILTFAVQLAGATMLLLFAVRMVRSGIELAFGSSIKRYVTGTSNLAAGAVTGLFLAVILQSSAAVTLLVTGFAGTGVLTFASGLPVIIGADLGSALIIQVLSFKVDWIMPALLAIGGFLYLKSERRSFKQAGIIILGIAFILISLRFLRETVIPIKDSNFLPAIASYLESDHLTAFIIGAVLTFVMHSSVAAILMCVTIVALDAMPVSAGIAIVLGANLGSSLIPIWLGRGLNNQAQRLSIANLFIRGAGAVLALFLFSRLPLPPWIYGMGNAQALINVHLLFNCSLLLALPVCRFFERPLKLLLPDVKAEESFNPLLRSALDENALDKPSVAFASVQREVLRMAQIVEGMVSPVMELYADYDHSRMKAITEQDLIVNKCLDDIKRYAVSIPDKSMDQESRHKLRELTEYAIALEAAGDIVVKQLLQLAKQKSKKGAQLSKDGSAELVTMHERLLSNMTLAMNLLISNDLESARLLLEEKTEMVRQERSSRKKHLKRLGKGSAISFESSNIHLETLNALAQFNNRVASIAFPILYRGGQLLETRLIEDMGEDTGMEDMDNADRQR